MEYNGKDGGRWIFFPLIFPLWNNLISYSFWELDKVVSQSVQSLSRVRLFVTPWTQHARSPCPSPTPGVHPKSCPSSRWCPPTISSPVVPFSSCLQSFPPSGSFPMSQLFVSGGQSTGVSASASVPPLNTQEGEVDEIELVTVSQSPRALPLFRVLLLFPYLGSLSWKALKPSTPVSKYDSLGWFTPFLLCPVPPCLAPPC